MENIDFIFNFLLTFRGGGIVVVDRKHYIEVLRIELEPSSFA